MEDTKLNSCETLANLPFKGKSVPVITSHIDDLGILDCSFITNHNYISWYYYKFKTDLSVLDSENHGTFGDVVDPFDGGIRCAGAS